MVFDGERNEMRGKQRANATFIDTYQGKVEE